MRSLAQPGHPQCSTSVAPIARGLSAGTSGPQRATGSVPGRPGNSESLVATLALTGGPFGVRGGVLGWGATVTPRPFWCLLTGSVPLLCILRNSLLVDKSWRGVSHTSGHLSPRITMRISPDPRRPAESPPFLQQQLFILVLTQ